MNTNKKYCEIVNLCIITHLNLTLNLDMDLSKMPDIASWISPFIHQLNILISLEDRGLINYLYSAYSLQDLGIFLSQYFIPIS